MPNAKDYNPLVAGLSISVTGQPKSGKSHMGASAVKWALANGKKPFVFAAPTREIESYAGLDVEYLALLDPDWKPSANSFKATAYTAMMKQIGSFEQTPPGLIVFDTMSAGPSEALWRDIMSGYNTDDFRKLGKKTREPYVTYQSRMQELLDRLDLLRYQHGTHILALWHQDIREIEGLGAARKEVGESGVTIHWDVGRLPVMRGSLRQDVHKWFGFNFYVEPVVGSNPHKAKLIVSPQDSTRSLAGVNLKPVLEALQKLPEVPNDFGKLVEIVQTLYKGVGK